MTRHTVLRDSRLKNKRLCRSLRKRGGNEEYRDIENVSLTIHSFLSFFLRRHLGRVFDWVLATYIKSYHEGLTDTSATTIYAQHLQRSLNERIKETVVIAALNCPRTNQPKEYAGETVLFEG